jgi:hypothetical protein
MRILSSNDLDNVSAYNKICLVVLLVSLSYHPFINPIVNTADILSVNGIPKLVIVNEDAVAAVANCTTVLAKEARDAQNS